MYLFHVFSTLTLVAWSIARARGRHIGSKFKTDDKSPWDSIVPRRILIILERRSIALTTFLCTTCTEVSLVAKDTVSNLIYGVHSHYTIYYAHLMYYSFATV